MEMCRHNFPIVIMVPYNIRMVFNNIREIAWNTHFQKSSLYISMFFYLYIFITKYIYNYRF